MRHRQEIRVSVHCVPLHPQIVSRVSHCLNVQQRGLRGVTVLLGTALRWSWCWVWSSFVGRCTIKKFQRLFRFRNEKQLWAGFVREVSAVTACRNCRASKTPGDRGAVTERDQIGFGASGSWFLELEIVSDILELLESSSYLMIF